MTASFPNSSFNLHTISPLGTVLVKLSDPCKISWSIFFYASWFQFHLGSALIWSSLYNQMSSAGLWSNHTIPRLCQTFIQHPIGICSSFSSFKFKLIFSKYVLDFHFSPSCKNPHYYLARRLCDGCCIL